MNGCGLQQIAEGRAGQAAAQGEVAIAAIALERLLAAHVAALLGGNHLLHSTQVEIPGDIFSLLGQGLAEVSFAIARLDPED